MSESTLTIIEPHPRYGPCDAEGFEDRNKLALHNWKGFLRQLSDKFLQHYLDLPIDSAERTECRRMIDALSEIYQETRKP